MRRRAGCAGRGVVPAPRRRVRARRASASPAGISPCRVPSLPASSAAGGMPARLTWCNMASLPGQSLAASSSARHAHGPCPASDPAASRSRFHVPDMVRPDAEARRRRPRPHPGDPRVPRRALRPLRVAPHGAPARGGGARQPPRRQVGAPPQGAHAGVPHGEPQGQPASHPPCCCCKDKKESSSSRGELY